jgi:LmbE family N-acetylglucosaminyl deacetylase
MKNSRTLIVAAHPDDEALGCGGTLARLKALGAELGVLWMTNGIGSRSTDPDQVAERARQRDAFIAKLNPSFMRYLDYPDNQLDSIDRLTITKSIELAMEEFLPTRVITHWLGDLNIDHQLTAMSVLTAARPLPGSTIEEIWGFEVLSSTEWSMTQPFNPSLFVDISQYWESKKELLAIYDNEMRDYPHARSYKSMEALAVRRGTEVGMNMAEGFHVYRSLVKDLS